MNTNTTTTPTGPALYVGTYAKYNNGSLKGAWLNIEDYSSREEFLEACAALHADESDPEFMFQDFSDMPRAYYSESSAPDASFWDEYLKLSEDERAAFGLFVDDRGSDATVEDFRDSYNGTWDSEADFAKHIAEETGAVSAENATWIVIDWEATWNCNLRHYYWSERDSAGNLHIFRR